MYLNQARLWGIMLGALMLTAACTSQAPVQDTTPSAGSKTGPPPAATAASPTSAPTSRSVAPASTAVQAPSVPEAAAIPVEAPVAAEVGYAIGDRIPDFELTRADGSTYTSQDLISEGRPVFFFFTASW